MAVVSRVFRLAAVAAAVLSLGGCVTAAVGPEHPGTRVRTKSPDPQKWVGTQTFGDKRSIFRCRPLACAELSIVSIRISQSPTRSPDPQALQKYAQEDAERQTAQTEQASSEAVGRLRDVVLMSSKVTKVKEFPAVHWEYRASSTDKTLYIIREMVFAGNSAVDIISTSFGLEVARRNSNDFIGVMEVEDFAPPAQAPPTR
jgi:hypothetical protein